MPKPFDLDELLNLVSNTFSEHNNIEIKDKITLPKNIYDSGPVVGKSMAMQEIYKLISRLVNTNLNLLISGESGTGKKLIAKSIHDLSSINNKLFLNLNMDTFNDYSLDNLLKNIQKYQNKDTQSFASLNGCSIVIRDVSESSLQQQKNLLDFIEDDFSPYLKTTNDFIKPRIIALTKKIGRAHV